MAYLDVHIRAIARFSPWFLCGSCLGEAWGVHITAIAWFSPWLLCGSRREGELGCPYKSQRAVFPVAFVWVPP